MSLLWRSLLRAVALVGVIPARVGRALGQLVRLVWPLIVALGQAIARAAQWALAALWAALQSTIRGLDRGVRLTGQVIQRSVQRVASVAAEAGRRLVSFIYSVAARVLGVGVALGSRVAAFSRSITAAAVGVRRRLSSGLQQVDRRLAGLFAGVGRRMASVTRWIAGLWHRVGRGLAAIARVFGDLIKQLGRDAARSVRRVAHAIGWVGRAPWRLMKAVGRLSRQVGQGVGRAVAKLAAPVITPIRKTFARQAKAEVLGVPTTPDRHAHRELLILLVGLAVILTVGLLVATQQTGLMPGPRLDLSRLLHELTPAQIIERLAGYSPSKLMAVMAFGLLAVAMVWFWVRMTLDAFRRDYASNAERTKWRLITLLLFAPGAVWYFFDVYNHWTIRQFIGHHFVSVMVTGVAIVVGTSTYGLLGHFNQQAAAEVQSSGPAAAPNLEVDAKTKESLLRRTRYGLPLQVGVAGRVDPFAPVPGLSTAPPPVPVATPSPTPSASPRS